MKPVAKFTLATGALLCANAAFAYNCDGLATWNASDSYSGSTVVQLNNTAYQANWWTQNQNPESHSGPWQEWTNLGNCDGDGGDTNQAPSANANGPYSAQLGAAIAFSSAGSSDSDGNIATYHWSFGDGNSSSQANPSHIYGSTGVYSVTLTVTDNDGDSSTASSSANITEAGAPNDCIAQQYNAGTQYAAGDIVASGNDLYECKVAGWCSSSASWAYAPGTGAHWQDAWSLTSDCVVDDNQAPSANANGPYSGSAGMSISFSSNGSSDSDGSIASYSWNFGDGNNSHQANPSHSYMNEGTYQVSLTVTDNDGAQASASTTASVTGNGENQAPIASISAPSTATIGSSVSFSSAGSSDPDGSLVSYSWSFGDGASSEQANPTHSYAAAGTYSVSLTVTDNEGEAGTASHTVRVGDTTGGDHGDKIIGYFAEWGIYGRNYHVKNIHTSGSAEKLTHIVYAFGNVKNGECTIGDSYAAYDKAYSAADSVDGVADTWDTGALRGNFGQLRRLKAMYPGLKVVWSFGGWTWSGGFGQAAANADHFADSCYDLVFDPRWADVFDGIDIDWEYPNECGLSCDDSGYDGYRILMKALRERFGNNNLVTAAIGAGETKLNAADYGGAAQYLDFYMLMTYDFFGAWAAEGPTAPHSPLYNYPGMPIEGFSSENGLQVLQSKGVPADKILLGIGFYGRGWTGVDQATPGGSAGGAATGTYEKGIEDYKVLKNTCPSTGTIAGTAYAKCGNNWWGYDTPATIEDKMDYAKQQGLGGAFFWELSGDTTDGELIRAMDNGLRN